MSNRITLDQLPKRYQDQVAQEIARHPSRKPANSQPIPEPPPASQKPATAIPTGKARLRQDRSGPNKWEREFESWVRSQHPTSAIHAQGIRWRLGNGVWYKTDIVVADVDHDRRIKLSAYEVKGFMRQHGAQVVKVAASLFWWVDFYLATKRTKKQGGGWSIERVLP